MSSLPRLILLQPNGTLLRDPILGMGRTGVIVQRDNTAIKLPLKYRAIGVSHDDIERLNIDADISHEVILHEKQVYKRLNQHEGIVPCLDLSGVGIQMALMTKGNLQEFLAQQRPIKSVQLDWFRDMARALIYIHDRRVIVADIASRNFLLADNLSIKFSDFTESSILPLDTDMQTADDHGYSIYTDIGQLGSVMYEVVTGQACEFNLFKHQPTGPATASWPKRDDLPDTQTIWLGTLIEKCWIKGMYGDASELWTALDSVILE